MLESCRSCVDTRELDKNKINKPLIDLYDEYIVNRLELGSGACIIG